MLRITCIAQGVKKMRNVLQFSDINRSFLNGLGSAEENLEKKNTFSDPVHLARV